MKTGSCNQEQDGCICVTAPPHLACQMGALLTLSVLRTVPNHGWAAGTSLTPCAQLGMRATLLGSSWIHYYTELKWYCMHMPVGAYGPTNSYFWPLNSTCPLWCLVILLVITSVTAFVSATQVSLLPVGLEIRVSSGRDNSVFSSNHTVTGGKTSSFDNAVFLHTGLATELCTWRHLGWNQAKERLSSLQHLSWCLFSDRASWIRLCTMYALYLVLKFFYSGGPELVLTTLKTYVVPTGVYSGSGMSKDFLLQFCVEQATACICTLCQPGNMSTTIQITEISFSFEGEVWSPFN